MECDRRGGEHAEPVDVGVGPGEPVRSGADDSRQQDAPRHQRKIIQMMTATKTVMASPNP
jgi:hypothetical protein